MKISVNPYTKDFKVIKDSPNEEIIEKSDYRMEDYTYVDGKGQVICLIGKLINIKDNKVADTSITKLKLYEEIVNKGFKTIDEIDLIGPIFFKNPMPSLIYNYDIVLNGVKKEQNVFLTKDECFADYLIQNGLIGTTILGGLKNSIYQKDFGIFERKNTFLIGKPPYEMRDTLDFIGRDIKTINSKSDYIKYFGEDNKVYKIVKNYRKYLEEVKNSRVLLDTRLNNSLKKHK